MIIDKRKAGISNKSLLCHERFFWTAFRGVERDIVITDILWISHWVWKCVVFWSHRSTWSDWSQWKSTLIQWWSITWFITWWCASLGVTENAWHIQYTIAWGFVFSYQILFSTFPWIMIRSQISKIVVTSGWFSSSTPHRRRILVRYLTHGALTHGMYKCRYGSTSSFQTYFKSRLDFWLELS